MLLVGRNGAGKTTLLRIATGFLDPDAGAVAIDGIAMAGARTRAQARLGYLPEHAPAPAELTVREHLRTRARLKGCGDACGRQGDARGGRRGPRGRSGSGRCRRGIASASGSRMRCSAIRRCSCSTSRPAAWIRSRPRELRDHLIEAAASERAVLVSSHAVADLEGLAARVAVLRDGELVACDTPARAVRADAGVAKARRRRDGAPGSGRMRALYWVWRRELQVTLRAPIVYLVGGLFLAVQGIAFAGLVGALSDPRRPAPLGALLEGQLSGTLLTWVLQLVVLTLLGMRTIADDKRSGGWELLLTAQVGEGAAVVGKWLAAVDDLCAVVAADARVPRRRRASSAPTAAAGMSRASRAAMPARSSWARRCWRGRSRRARRRRRRSRPARSGSRS